MASLSKGRATAATGDLPPVPSWDSPSQCLHAALTRTKYQDTLLGSPDVILRTISTLNPATPLPSEPEGPET